MKFLDCFVTHEKTHAKLKKHRAQNSAHTTMQFEDALLEEGKGEEDNTVGTGSSSGINSRTPPPPLHLLPKHRPASEESFDKRLPED